MLKSLEPLTQTCANCGQENLIEQASTVPQSEPLGIRLPACPKCGAQEFLFVLTMEQNPGEHASMVRELAASLGLSERTDPAYFPQG